MTRKEHVRLITIFLESHGLFVPLTVVAIESTYNFLKKGNAYGYGGKSETERIHQLRLANSEFIGATLRHKTQNGDTARVLYLLPKTQGQLDRQVMYNRTLKDLSLEVPIEPYRICVRLPGSSKIEIKDLEMWEKIPDHVSY